MGCPPRLDTAHQLPPFAGKLVLQCHPPTAYRLLITAYLPRHPSTPSLFPITCYHTLPFMEQILDHYIDAFSRLRVNSRNGHTSPHKPVMLLAILSLADNGRLPANRILYGPDLLELFREYFDVVKTAHDTCTPLLPFFHLRSDTFWHHRPLAGREPVYEALSDPGGAGKLAGIVEYAYLDDALFNIVATIAGRAILRDTLINRYFSQHRAALLAISNREGNIGKYREILEVQAKEGYVEKAAAGSFREDVRSAGFRRIVTEAYDYQCAACGFRVIMDDLVLVDAAHLIPFETTADDDPRNGMALCKNHHWAMDRYLIAPGPDGKWHVSPDLDDRIHGQREILSLASRNIILPVKDKYKPKQESLEWRMQHLRKPA